MPTSTILRAFSLLMVLFLFAACSKEVEANFEYNTTEIVQGEAVTFSDISLGEPTNWEWTFEGGSPATSTEQNPTVVYNEVGEYMVSLKVFNKKKENTKTVSGAVTVSSFVNYEEQFFTTYTKTENVVYGVNSTEHLMHIYEPDGDDRPERPFVFIFGGGAFQGSNLAQLEPIAAELTTYGIVVGVARYRSGPISDPATRFVEGQQDTRAAVRFMRANAATYRVDPNMIIHGGYGTGAFLALLHTYMDASELPQNQQAFVDGLGGWEGDQGNPGYSSQVQACVSMAGGIYTDRSQIVAGDPPLFCIHGDNDLDVPYDYEINSGDTTFGPVKLIESCNAASIYNGLYTIVGGGHNSPVSAYPDYTPDLMVFLKQVIEQ